MEHDLLHTHNADQAARWKLDWILHCDHGSTGGYAEDYIVQLVIDYRRFLTGETPRGQ